METKVRGSNLGWGHRQRAAVSQKAAETKQLSPRLAGEWFGIFLASVYWQDHEHEQQKFTGSIRTDPSFYELL